MPTWQISPAWRAWSIFNLAGPFLTDAGLVSLNTLTRLETLKLSESQVTSAGLVHLGRMVRLEFLILDNTRVADLSPLRPLSGLRRLSLQGTPVDDAGLAPIADLTNVYSLSLGGPGSATRDWRISAA